MYEETVMSDEQINILLLRPVIELGTKSVLLGIDELDKVKEHQAEITWPIAEKAGIKKVVEIVRDWETIPSREFNKKYQVKLIDDVEDETLLQIIERYLQAFLKEVEK